MSNSGGARLLSKGEQPLVSVVDLSTDHDTLASVADVAINPAPVPEPESLMLVGTGGLAMFGAVRRRIVR